MLPAGPEPDSPVLPLPVLQGSPTPYVPVPRRSSIARWRAGVLAFFCVLIVAHVLHWWITGRSFGRFVMSDSMRTLELGEINPGFLLFAGSLLITALLGRFMCGWVCHMGALQDLCAWLLRKAGLRPRLFRARVLGYVPLVLAAYMFVWPTFYRVVVIPVLAWADPSADGLQAAASFPGFSTDFTTERMWDGLPSLEVAIPFLLVCGFATVYFLGARGLCRYGCPYGGFLLPAEQLAVMRVVADRARCDECGLCTSACTSGVRVHDEVRRYGAVLDRNCMRSFDCIGVCPTRALSFSLARPGVFFRRDPSAPASAQYDLSLGEELLCITAFVAVFLVTRGLYDLVPMLLASTLGTLAAFLAWKAWRLVRDADVRLGFWQLRQDGRVRPAGRVFEAAMAAMGLLLVHSLTIRIMLARASFHDEQVRTSFEEAVGGGRVGPEDREHAMRAQSLYTLVRPIGRGGIALAATPEAEFRLAWVDLVCGDRSGAESVLREMAGRDRTRDAASYQLARVLLTDGRTEEAVASLEAAFTFDARAFASRDFLAILWARTGRAERAETMYRELVADHPGDNSARAGLGRVLCMSGRTTEGIQVLGQAAEASPGNVDIRREYAMALFSNGHRAAAIAELEAAARARPAQGQELRAMIEDLSHRSRSP